MGALGFSEKSSGITCCRGIGICEQPALGMGMQATARGSTLLVPLHPLERPKDRQTDTGRHAQTAQTELDMGWEQAAPAQNTPKLLALDKCLLRSAMRCEGEEEGRATETNLPCETLMVNKRRQRNMKEREREKCNCRLYIRNT